MKLARLVFALALAGALAPNPALAAPKFLPFGEGENCGDPASVDGDYAAVADERTGNLIYVDLKNNTRHQTGLVGMTPSLKGTKIAYFGVGADAGKLFVYDLATGVNTQTPVTSAVRRWWRVASRYFSGRHIAYIDGVDNHVKYYALADGTITDTGLLATGDPTVDGNVIAAGDAIYEIGTGVTTQLEPGAFQATVAGNVVVYAVGENRWTAELRYRLLDSGRTVSTGIVGSDLFSTDGTRIIASLHGEHLEAANANVKKTSSFLLVDVATGTVSATGFTGCSDMSTCWVDISGRNVVYERWEGGTKDYSTNEIVYPPTDYDGDGSIDSDCVAGYTRI